MDVRNENFQIEDLASSNQFFNNVPKPMELAFVCACLGATIQYKKEKSTGLDELCMIVPNKKGFEPVVVTLGNEDSVGNGNYEATYHKLGLDNIITMIKKNNEAEKLNSIDDACLDSVSEVFYRNIGFTLGKGNKYEQMVLTPMMDKLESTIKDPYPEYYSNFVGVKSKHLQNFKATYSEEKKAVSKEENQNQLNA